jgi:hypothetical protein
MRKAHPGIKFRIIAEWEVECPKCGCKLYFHPTSRRMAKESMRKQQ